MEFDRQADGSLEAAARAVDRHRHGPRAHHRRAPGHESNYDTDLFAPILDEIGKLAGKTIRPLDEPGRCVDARHGGSLAHGRLPDCRRRHAVERIPRLRASQDHAPRDAARHEARHHGDVSSDSSSTSSSARWATRIRSCARTATPSSAWCATKRSDSARCSRKAIAASRICWRPQSSRQSRQISGDEAFKLHDTFGVPLDFIEDLAGERRVTVDREGFERAMQRQQDKARVEERLRRQERTGVRLFLRRVSAGIERGRRSLRGIHDDDGEGHAGDRAVRQGAAAGEGADGRVRGLRGARADAVLRRSGRTGIGRRPAPRGRIGGLGARRRDVAHRLGHAAAAPHPADERNAARARHHHGRGGCADARCDAPKPHGDTSAPCGAAKGAGVAREAGRARSSRPIGCGSTSCTRRRSRASRLLEIERIVNEQIYRNAPVVTEERSTQEAMASGAMALFGEKYGDRVRVVSIPGFSMELCGGTHCRATGDIGFFTIVSEGGVAAGVRRIEAVTGASAVQHSSVDARDARRSAGRARHDRRSRARGDRAPAVGEQAAGARDQQAEGRRRAQPAGRLRRPSRRRQFARGTFVAQTASGLGKDELRQLADAHRDRIKTGVVVIGSVDDGRVSLVVAVTKDLVPKVHAGNIVKELAPVVGGRGGGRPDFAEAGGNLVESRCLGHSPKPRSWPRRPSVKVLHRPADTRNRSGCVYRHCGGTTRPAPR